MENEKRTRLHVKPGPVKYTKGYTTKLMISRFINLIIVLIMAAIVSTVIFVYVKQPVKTENGYLWSDPLYEIAEHGQKVVVVEGKNTNAIITPIKRFLFTQNAYEAKVVAGPYGKVELANGKYRVSDGDDIISVNLDTNSHKFLDSQYIVRKIEKNGESIKDEFDVILERNEVLGKVIENQ